MKPAADGACDIGFTDSDDFFVAKVAGNSVAMLPVLVADARPICIPNSGSLIKGTKRQRDAQRLAEFLLSAETELSQIAMMQAEISETQAIARGGCRRR
jgi:iron(III) transport system substrate-binding protein